MTVDNEQLVKELSAKDETKALSAAKMIVDNTNTAAFELLADRSEFLFDFVKNNVNKRLQKSVNKDNYRNLFAFLKIYAPDFEDTIVGCIAQYANEDLTDEMFELLENGTDEEKTYAAKYFSFIPDTIAADILSEYAFSDNEALAFNAAKALGAMKVNTAYDRAIELLKSEDDFTEAMEHSSMSENIAGEIPYIQSLMELLQGDFDKNYVLLCIDNILSGLGEILPLNQVFCFEMYEVLEYLIQYNTKNKNSQASVVLLKAMSKFETLASNEEYTFDEDKNTKQEIQDIYHLLKKQQEYFWNAQKNLVKNELSENDIYSYRISSALRAVSEYKLVQFENEIKELLSSNNEILICEAAGALKQLDKLNGVNKNQILNKIHDENKKAIIESMF